MSRLALFILSCAVFAPVTFTSASPVPVVNGELVNVEKRASRTGRGTWYYPGMGNCGWMSNSNQPVLAIGKGLYDSDGGSNCGQWVTITNTANGKTAGGTVVDSCQSCGPNDIDLSPNLFGQIADLNTGVIQVTWNM